ncbi:MAG: GEVED domain-containing protein, partial [Weeksellaceae bacterium]
MGGDDVVYAYTPTADGMISVSANLPAWSGLFAFTGCAFDSTVGYHTSSSAGTRTISGLMVTAGETYYFVISSWPSPQSIAYTIQIEEVIPCEGTPNGGTATVTPTSGPSGTVAAFSVTGQSNDVGITYDWEYSVDGGEWQSTGANAANVNLTITGDHGTVFTVRYAATCAPSGETGYSNEVTFTVDNAGCIPNITNVEPITRVLLTDEDTNTLIDNSSSASSSSPNYEDYTAVEANVIQGMDYTITLEGYTGGNYTNFFTVWVDWNQDGAFSNSEITPIGSIVNSTGTDGKQAIGTLSVPADALVGSTTMRIIKNYNASPTNPCGPYSFGQTEDYTVNIINGGVEPIEYCIPEGTNVNRYISNFSTADGSENISNMDSGFSDGGYGDFYDTMGVTQIRGV